MPSVQELCCRRTRFFIGAVIAFLGSISPLVGTGPIFHENESSLLAKWSGIGTSVAVSPLIVGLGCWARVSMFRTAEFSEAKIDEDRTRRIRQSNTQAEPRIASCAIRSERSRRDA